MPRTQKSDRRSENRSNSFALQILGNVIPGEAYATADLVERNLALLLQASHSRDRYLQKFRDLCEIEQRYVGFPVHTAILQGNRKLQGSFGRCTFCLFRP